MKIRNGFVSNSSSSSFVIPKDKIDEIQKLQIYNHISEANKHSQWYNFGCIEAEDGWSISENEYYISGYCHMDNFDMYVYLLDFLKIPREMIKWGE